MINPELVDRALDLIKRRADYEYFFNNLTSPDWIMPLRDKGFFANPPEPVEENGHIWFPPWPESNYLMRVAAEAPKIVLEVALDIPETENTRVQEDLIGAALKMPPDLAATLSSRVARWLETPYLLLPTKAASLVSHLASGEQTDGALSIARELLKVVPGKYVGDDEDRASDLPWKPEPRPRIDLWEYEQFIKVNLADLVESAAKESLSLLSNQLDEVLKLHKADGTPKFEDFSRVWRPAIEPHPQNTGFGGVRDLLVNAVRDAAIKVVEQEPDLQKKVVHELETRSWKIFKRIALYLVNHFSELDTELVESKLRDKNLFNDSSFRHEYAVLARERFGHVGEDVRDSILSWIQAGPDLSAYANSLEREDGRRPSEESLQTRSEYWQLRWLAVVKDNLPKDMKRSYEALVEKHGEPEHPDLVSWSSGVHVGPTSPIEPDQIEDMAISDLVNFICKWKPSSGFMVESPEGLSRALTEAVSKNPDRYAKEAEEFVGLHASYVRGIIAGFRDAAGKRKPFAWEPVLELCRWVMDQPREIDAPEQFKFGEADPHWGWARQEIARLLEEGLKKSNTTIAFDLRDHVWRIIYPLTNDPDPTIEHEEKYGGSNMDPSTLSINTTRGAALHTTIRFILWCQTQLSQQDAEGVTVPFSMEETPKAKEVLETHLDTSQEKSLAVRSVYGWWFGALLNLDREWTIAHKQAIFPIIDAMKAYRDAVWNTFIQFNRPATVLLDVLQSEYRRALKDDEYLSDRVGWSGNPQEKLAEHLMVYYWWGDLSIDSSLFRGFWTTTPERIKAYALNFVGRSLYNTSEELPTEIADRLMKLWEMRLKKVIEKDAKDLSKKEIASFGWWFASGKLPESWSISQLEQVLKYSDEIEASHLVVEQLASFANNHPRDAVALLAALVEGDRQGWGLLRWRDSSMKLLERALESKDRTTKKAAEDLIHRLGARGYLVFGDLLN